MIEAVNSVLSNAQVLRAGAEQASPAAVVSPVEPNTEGQTIEVPKAPYVSPYISVDLASNKAVLQIRDSNTGDVVRQFPSERSLRLRLAEQAAAEARRAHNAEEGQEGVRFSPSRVRVNAARIQGVRAEEARVQAARAEDAVALPSVSPGAGQAKIASAALTSGAQTAVQTQSAGVSVLA